MSALTTEQIVKILSMPKIGRKTAMKLIKAISFKISNDNDLMDFINENGKGLRLPSYSIEEFVLAFERAEQILLDSEKEGIKLVNFQEDTFPKLLLQTNDCPIVLNYKGDISKLNETPSVALIGTREPTNFGAKFGTRLGEVFAEQKFNIVSGLAVGCDTAGHRGALNAKGLTTAVLAHGLDKVYPKENKELAKEILDSGGLLVSEYFVRQNALSNFFVERDRIQAGLSLGVIVIETGIKGGTMHTVRFCLENNRPLATLNHPTEHLWESKTQGNQLLIRERKAIPIFQKSEVDTLMNNLRAFFIQGSYKTETKITSKDTNIDIDVVVNIPEQRKETVFVINTFLDGKKPNDTTQGAISEKEEKENGITKSKLKGKGKKTTKKDDKVNPKQPKLWD
ncbi:DNA-protecting protein DprA [Chitinophaga oryzae]|uniref:DNA-protecting protein DprA n=1 Tax=Chitinophaga oryzae TaxID=2725414 RepID=A0AAE6ZDA4_9BACT|nr:DNA-processing protein DprA [Chitinophaga oryzae]QJB29890.1 DNA-protecting protein DprA [Chitinophaga oryzae]